MYCVNLLVTKFRLKTFTLPTIATLKSELSLYKQNLQGQFVLL